MTIVIAGPAFAYLFPAQAGMPCFPSREVCLFPCLLSNKPLFGPKTAAHLRNPKRNLEEVFFLQKRTMPQTQGTEVRW